MIRYYVFFFSLALDFKGTSEGGGVVQFFLLLMILSSSLFIIMKFKLPHHGAKKFKIIIWLLLVFLVTTLITVLYQGVDLQRYIRVSLPYALLFLGYFVGGVSFYHLGFKRTLNLMLWAAGTAVVFNIFYGFFSTGLSINEIRYQILSPMLFFLIPALLYKFHIEGRNRKPIGTLLVLLFFLGLIAATRSWLLAFILTLALANSVAERRKGKNIVVSSTKSLLLSLFLLLSVTVSFYFFMPDVVFRVINRILSSSEVGFDITVATRIAEINYQISAWTTGLDTFLIGLGLGASYGLSGDALLQIIDLFGEDTKINEVRWFAGHNFWVYSFFSQGILFGWFIPFIIIYAIYKSWVGAVRYPKLLFMRDRIISSQLVLCLLVLVSVILSTIGGNPFGSRMLSQYLGVIIAMFFLMHPLLEARKFLSLDVKK